MSNISFPKKITGLQSVVTDDLKVDEASVVALATYEMVGWVDDQLITGRAENVSLDNLCDSLHNTVPTKFHMDAIRLGFGASLVQPTIEQISEITQDQIEMILPLFVVHDKASDTHRVVIAEYKMDPSTDKRRARLGMMLHYPVSTDSDSSVTHLAGVSYADLGFISSHWSVKAIINASSQWFGNYLRRANVSEKCSIFDSCASTFHKRKIFTAPDGPGDKEIIEVAVTGICGTCKVIEHSTMADIPF